MNYAVVAIGGVLLLVTILWFVWGWSRFNGPVKTVERRSAEREDAEVDEKNRDDAKEAV